MLNAAQNAATEFVMISNQITPIIEIEIPNMSAAFAEIAPDGIGRFAVLSIIGSMSRSYHILIEFAPPAVRYPPMKTMIIVSKLAA